jgi:hypothetical protein
MPTAEGAETMLDRDLVRGTLAVGLGCVIPAAALGAWAAGSDGAAGAAWGAGAVALNGAAAAWISSRGASTSRGIGIGRVVIALPIRLVLLALALVVGITVLGLPATPTALAVCCVEGAVMVVQSWLVLHGSTFVGPLNERRI